MARDLFHENVKEALIKEGWIITNDPLSFKIGNVQVQIDLGAERLIAAERGTDKIAIEIKTFGSLSFITALYEAIGKYIIYRNVLAMREPERLLYLAVPENIYKRFFEGPVIQKTMQEEKFKLVIYNQESQIISQWITR
ncbi:MAG: XisH family protein [Saprospiraceae bacterium]|nr:XisH family protein [Saprospiraceae bacterium]